MRCGRSRGQCVHNQRGHLWRWRENFLNQSNEYGLELFDNLLMTMTILWGHLRKISNVLLIWQETLESIKKTNQQCVCARQNRPYPPNDVYIPTLRPVNILPYRVERTLQMWLNQRPWNGEINLKFLELFLWANVIICFHKNRWFSQLWWKGGVTRMKGQKCNIASFKDGGQESR